MSVPVGALSGGYSTTKITITVSSIPNVVAGGTPEDGSPYGALAIPATTYIITNVSAIAGEELYPLNSGDNLITIPSNANVGSVKIQGREGNTVQLKVSPGTGIAGIPINRQAPFLWPLESALSGGGSQPSSFCINAASGCSVLLTFL